MNKERHMKILKKLSIKKIIYALLTFILAMCLVVSSVLLIVRITVFNRGFLTEALTSGDYYRDLCGEITDSLTDIGDASGLDRSFFDGVVDEVLVRGDVQAYIDDFYSGKELEVNTAKFEESLCVSLNKYIKSNNIKNVDENNINYFVDKACKIYSNSVRIKYFGTIQKKVNEKTPTFSLYIIILTLVSAGIICVLLFTNEWKHRAIRYIHTAVSSAGLLLLIVPSAIMVSGLIGKIAILSRSLNDMYMAIISGVLWDVIIVAVVLLVISVALWVVHAKVRRKSAI